MEPVQMQWTMGLTMDLTLGLPEMKLMLLLVLLLLLLLFGVATTVSREDPLYVKILGQTLASGTAYDDGQFGDFDE